MSLTAIERLARDLNAAWLEGRFDDLAPLFHERVVMMPPGAVQPIVGRDAMVESYRQFVAAAKVLQFEILDLRADTFGDTGVAAVRFEIGYEMQGSTQRDRGTDILVLNREESSAAWRVVWRTQLPEPPA